MIMKIYDISRTVSPQTAVWPGDGSFSYSITLSKSKGDAANLTRISLSPHTGTHVDAGWHFHDEGNRPCDMPLEKFIGPAQLITLEREAGPITVEEVASKVSGKVERLLIHSVVSNLKDTEFAMEYPYPSIELIDWLADQGAVLLGLDSPSMDDMDSKDLAGHNHLRQRGLVHLELLQLKGVPDGEYELIALPLKFAEVCGTPIRAILRTLA